MKNKKNNSLITFLEPNAIVSEAYRMLRTSLHYINIEEKNKTIMLTSPNENEGKTTTIANLAVTIAQTNKKVLLIDCDLRKPNIHKLLNIDNTVGLSNIITENLEYKEAIQSTHYHKKLSIITSGSILPDPSPLFQSNSMRDFLEKTKEEFDIVLIDSPPINLVSDGAILSKLVDGVVVIISSKETKIESAKDAIGTLNKIKANIIGILLTKVKLPKKAKYYMYTSDGSKKLGKKEKLKLKTLKTIKSS